MDLDFKDRTFSFIKLRKKRLRRRILFVSLLVIFSLIFLFYKDLSTYKQLRKSENLLFDGQIVESLGLLNKIGSPFFRRSSYNELKGVLKLIRGDIKSGEELLSESVPGHSSIRSKKVLTFLSDNCFYKALDIYSSLLPQENDYVKFYRIVSGTSLFRAKESNRRVEEFNPSNPEKYSDYIKTIKDINNKMLNGNIDFIFDRDGEPLASYNINYGESISLTPGLYFHDFDSDLTNGLKFVKLSIDKDIQIKIHTLFKKYHGSFILTDLEDGSIIASYSKPFDKNKENTALTEKYEPGSVIKLLTLFAFMNSSEKTIFPFNCTGHTVYEGKVFYDWSRHDKLPSFVQALSRSCNIVFAKMGILTGDKGMSGVLNNFMFNKKNTTNGKFDFNFGNFSTSQKSKRDLANLSIGLEHISITTIHAAIISSLIAQNGDIIFPFMVMSKKNIFNMGYFNHKSEYTKVYLNNRYFEDIKTGMHAVTTDPKGTGRRAKVDFMEIGIKTGTSGKKKLGFDSVITGFFPFEKPRYSFAFRLERGGKAEYNGALFLHDFIKSFYGRE